MDVKKFQDSRKAELAAFKKQYEFLKREYSSTLSAAIKEADSNQQLALIQRVQLINKQLANEVRSIVTVLNKGTNKFQPRELDALTNDLIKYQKDYAEIEKSKDKIETLKLIKQSTSETLNNATFMFYMYIVILVALSIYVAYLVLTTTWSQNMRAIFSIKPSG